MKPSHNCNLQDVHKNNNNGLEGCQDPGGHTCTAAIRYVFIKLKIGLITRIDEIN